MEKLDARASAELLQAGMATPTPELVEEMLALCPLQAEPASAFLLPGRRVGKDARRQSRS